MAKDKEEDREANGGDKRDGRDDDDLFSLITVLNLRRYRENLCIKEYLLVVCGHKDTKKKLKLLLEEKATTVGLLV